MSDEQGYTVGEIVHALQRRRRIVLLSALIGLVLAFGATSVLSGSYVARAQVNVEKITGNEFTSGLPLGDDINMAAERNNARSDAVLLEVISQLELPESRDDLLEIGVVSINSGSFSTTIDPTLTIEVEHSNSEKAAAIANTWAEVYLAQRTRLAEERIADNIAGNTAEIDRMQADATDAFSEASEAARDRAQALPGLARDLTAQFPGLSSSDALTVAEASLGTSEEELEATAEAERLTSAIGVLEAANAELAALTVTPGVQTRVASVPESTTGLGGILAGIAAFGLALTGGCFLALVVDRFDPRVRDDDELAELLSAGHHHTAAPDDPRSRALLAGVAVRVVNSEVPEPRRLLVASLVGRPPLEHARQLVNELEVAGERCLVLASGGSGLRLNSPRANLDDVVSGDVSFGELLAEESAGDSLWLVAASSESLRSALAPESMRELRRLATQHGLTTICVVAGSPADDTAISQLTHAIDRTVFFTGERPSRAEVGAASEALRSLDIAVDELVTT